MIFFSMSAYSEGATQRNTYKERLLDKFERGDGAREDFTPIYLHPPSSSSSFSTSSSEAGLGGLLSHHPPRSNAPQRTRQTARGAHAEGRRVTGAWRARHILIHTKKRWHSTPVDPSLIVAHRNKH